jgi:hypothetical protein
MHDGSEDEDGDGDKGAKEEGASGGRTVRMKRRGA